MSVTENPLTLDEVSDILAPDSGEDVANVLQTEEERSVAAKILPRLAAKVQAEERVRQAKKLDAQVTELKVANEKALKETLDKIQKDAKPLEPAEIEKLLSQEYLTVTFKVPRRGGDVKEQEFIIQELPASVEKKFVKVLKEKLMPYVKEITSVDFRTEADQSAKIQKFIEIVPDALELMGELAVIVLNPRKEFDYVTQDWVMDNLSSYRIFNALMAQVAVNRIRDFFSGAYQEIRP